jgi:hypothetical protein
MPITRLRCLGASGKKKRRIGRRPAASEVRCLSSFARPRPWQNSCMNGSRRGNRRPAYRLRSLKGSAIKATTSTRSASIPRSFTKPTPVRRRVTSFAGCASLWTRWARPAGPPTARAGRSIPTALRNSGPLPQEKMILQRQAHGGALKGETTPFAGHAVQHAGQQSRFVRFQGGMVAFQEATAHLFQPGPDCVILNSESPPGATHFLRRNAEAKTAKAAPEGHHEELLPRMSNLLVLVTRSDKLLADMKSNSLGKDCARPRLNLRSNHFRMRVKASRAHCKQKTKKMGSQVPELVRRDWLLAYTCGDLQGARRIARSGIAHQRR